MNEHRLNFNKAEERVLNGLSILLSQIGSVALTMRPAICPILQGPTMIPFRSNNEFFLTASVALTMSLVICPIIQSPAMMTLRSNNEFFNTSTFYLFVSLESKIIWNDQLEIILYHLKAVSVSNHYRNGFKMFATEHL